MPTMTNPNPCIGSAVLDNAPDGSALFRALGGHYTSPAQAVCEFIDDSLSSIAANGDEVGEVFLRVTDRGELVELSVTDSGSGIADLGAALTISDRSVAQTPYNEHGCGLKSALSHLCGGAEDWSIETRTADDAAADRYRCVSAPYAAVNAHMTERIYAGSGDIPWVTGTIVRLRCPMPRFAQLKPASRRTPADFCQLVDYLAEELRYTYAPLLASGQLILSILRCEQNGHEQLLSLDALEPEWDGDAVELPETKLDLGGGPVTVRCRYGTIEADKENATYYKGNMASSGLEIRINGRCIERGLYSKVFGKALHPSCNRFLAQIDLLVSKTDGMTIYEAKAKNTKAEDLYQLRLYADGCAMEGVPAKESVLIGARHPKEVCSLAEQLNSQCDPTGAPYHFVLRTWAEEGISA